MAHRIIVAGIGPGHPDYMVPAARKAIAEANVLVGGQRALSQFAHDGQQTMAVRGDIPAVLAYLREKLEECDVVCMVSGDPGYYSLLDALRREFSPETLTVLPGISSMQLAFSRLALPWHGATLLSLHGREPEEATMAYQPGRILGMLTDAKHTSRTVPQLLLRLGWPADTPFFVCARLSYDDEMVRHTTLSRAAGDEETEVANCILVVTA